MMWMLLLIACATNVELRDTAGLGDGTTPATVPTVGTIGGGGGTAGTGGGTGGFTTGGAVPVPFAVDDYFAASGYMGDAEIGGLVDSPDCDRRAGEATGICHRLLWTPAGRGWTGVYWQAPENNWGQSPGMPIAPGATAIRAWVWSDTPITVEVFAGGIAGTYADGFDVGGSIDATTEPAEVVMDLTGVTYDQVIGGFGFSFGGEPVSPVTVYIDDITWE